MSISNFSKPDQNLNIILGELIELVALAVKSSVIRCKILGTEQPITYRHRRDEVEGEILTVKPNNVWPFKNTWYLSGELKSTRIDIPSLGLTPLKLEEMPEEESTHEQQILSSHSDQKGIFAPGGRKEYEMEQIIQVNDEVRKCIYSFDDVLEFYESQRSAEAFDLVKKILEIDLRCLDAHHFLGTRNFNSSDDFSPIRINRAKRHFEIGVNIGELSLPNNFKGLLPWTWIDNRPFLRCIHGYGLSLWRLGEIEEAREVFQRMLWLNPEDQQGVGIILADIDRGLSWNERVCS